MSQTNFPVKVCDLKNPPNFQGSLAKCKKECHDSLQMLEMRSGKHHSNNHSSEGGRECTDDIVLCRCKGGLGIMLWRCIYDRN